MAIAKRRLDVVVSERFPAYTRTQIASWIMQEKVMVGGTVITKPGTLVADDVEIILDVEPPRYVSRGGFKLEHALKHFGLDIRNMIALDAGISTGGFTDCLLQHGVKKVYGIDVGVGQVHEKIAHDPRLILMEKVNLRHLEKLPDKIDIATLDLSFISLLKVLPAVEKLLASTGLIIALIKPQFEAGRHEIRRGGVVTDPAVHQAVIQRVVEGFAAHGFATEGVVESPIRGAAGGNIEFLALFKRKTS